MKRPVLRSVLARYIISYAAVMAVLFLGIGLYAVRGFDAAIRDNVLETNTNRLAILRVEHEEKLNALLNISNQVSLSPYISPFKFRESPMEAYHIHQQLSASNAANNPCDPVYLTCIGDDYLYSSATSVSIDMFAANMLHYEHLTPDALEKLLRGEQDSAVFLPSQRISSSLTSATNRPMTTVILPIRLDGKLTIGNLLFLIEDAAYQQMFGDAIEESRDMFIFHGGEALARSGRLPVSTQAVAEAVYSGEKSFVRELSLDGGDYILFVQQGNLFDMRYASLIPQETVHTRTLHSRLAFCLFLFLFSIPCSLLVVYLSRRQTRPIRELQKSFGDAGSLEDDFSVIRNGIESLIGQNMDLHTKLGESLSVRRADFAKNFVKKRYESREKAVAAAGQLDLSVDRAHYMVCILAADLGERYDPMSLYKLTGGDGEVTGCGVEIVSQEQTLLVLFSDSGEALLEWAATAKTALTAVDRDATVAISGIHGDFSKADTAYLEACAAYDNRFVMGIEHVLTFADVSVSTEDAETFTRSYLDAFRKALLQGDSEELGMRISDLFLALSQKKYSIFTFRLIFNELINTLLSMRGGTTSLQALRYYDIFTLSRCRRVSDLSGILRQLCDEILLSAAEHSKGEGEPSLSQKVTAYMREHYTDPSLTMGHIAEVFQISTTRLSLLYKEQAGIRPSTYLLMLRMEQAKELLAATDLPVKEIATSVGYYDASGFIRRFKQHTALTPVQYRQSVRKNPERRERD